MSCKTPLGEDPWKLVSGFLQTSPHAPFPLLMLVCILFVVINQEYDYRLNLVSPSETLNLGIALGTLTHRAVIITYKSLQKPIHLPKSVAEEKSIIKTDLDVKDWYLMLCGGKILQFWYPK